MTLTNEWVTYSLLTTGLPTCWFQSYRDMCSQGPDDHLLRPVASVQEPSRYHYRQLAWLIILALACAIQLCRTASANHRWWWSPEEVTTDNNITGSGVTSRCMTRWLLWLWHNTAFPDNYRLYTHTFPHFKFTFTYFRQVLSKFAPDSHSLMKGLYSANAIQVGCSEKGIIVTL